MSITEKRKNKKNGYLLLLNMTDSHRFYLFFSKILQL